MLSKSFLTFALGVLVAGPCNAATLYFSATGSGSVCSASAPCSNWFYIDQNSVDGDTITCLTPLTGNSIYITRSITIDCSGARGIVRDGGLLVPDNGAKKVGIAIEGNPIAVTIKGLTIDGGRIGSGTANYDRGIDISSGGTITIEDCVIVNTNGSGIVDRRSAGQTKLIIKNTTISGHNGPGIVARSNAVGATILDNVNLLNNSYGIAAATGNNVAITRSVISGNRVAGISADGGSQINLSNSVLSHNTAHVNNYGTVRVKDNDLEFSNVALQGNAPISMGANRFSGNGSLGAVPTTASGAPADVFN